MRILISGAGVAGPTLAYWLAHYGLEPTIVESAPALRRGGYVIDLWGAGFDVAEKMRLLPELRARGYRLNEVRVVDSNGGRVAGFSANAFARMTHDRYLSLPRGELSASIFNLIEGRVETIFGDSVDRIEQTPDGVHVTFEHGGPRDFDLVVGADGLHSKVRSLIFGEESRFERYLGIKVAAFQVEGYEPRDELVYVMYTEVGRQVARFSMRDNRTMFLLTFADANPAGPANLDAQKALLRERFGRSGWECPRILAALDDCNDLYFDRVSQIRMDPSAGLWTRGRVTLLGDGASCVSLLAGQGSALAMIAAYVLAGELHRCHGDHAQAFRKYQAIFVPFVAAKQRAALRFAGMFAPKSRSAMWLRNRIFNLLSVPWIADLAARSDLADRIVLPSYE